MENKREDCNMLCNDTCNYICGKKPANLDEKHEEHKEYEEILNIQDQINNYFKDEPLYKTNIPNNENSKITIPLINKNFYKLNILISNELEKYTLTEANYEVIGEDMFEFLPNLLSEYKDGYVINIDGFDPLMLFYTRTQRLIETIKNCNNEIPIMITSNCKLIDDNMIKYFNENNIILSVRIRNNEIDDNLFNRLRYINQNNIISMIEIDCKKDKHLLSNIKKLYSNGDNKIELLNLCYCEELNDIIEFYLKERNLNIYTLDHMVHHYLNKESYGKNELFEIFLSYDLKLYYPQYQSNVDFTETEIKIMPKCKNCKLFDLCKLNNIILDCNYEGVYDLLINTINELYK